MVQLTTEQLAALHDASDQIELIKAEIARAESAGLDMSAMSRQLAEVERLRQGLLKVYGGNIRRRVVS